MSLALQTAVACFCLRSVSCPVACCSARGRPCSYSVRRNLCRWRSKPLLLVSVCDRYLALLLAARRVVGRAAIVFVVIYVAGAPNRCCLFLFAIRFLSCEHRRFNRHAWTKLMTRVLTFVKTNANRNALHHFYVVASCVFGRKQAKSRSRGSA
jgi:hypothetical protein